MTTPESVPTERVPCVCSEQLVRPYPNDTGEHSTTECPAPNPDTGVTQGGDDRG